MLADERFSIAESIRQHNRFAVLAENVRIGAKMVGLLVGMAMLNAGGDVVSLFPERHELAHVRELLSRHYCV
ncbi:hypothetical protein NUACC26_098440 [Scytonema sp. NUACC26]